MQRGIVYVAAGEAFLEEAVQSAASAKRHNPELPVAIVADRDVTSTHVDTVMELSDPAYSWVDSVLPPRESPYERTLLLDTDTYVCGPLKDLFALLDRFEIAVAQCPVRRAELSEQPYAYTADGVPDSFPMYQCGVMLYRDSPGVNALFDRWLAIYDEHAGGDGVSFTQPAFRQALFESDVRFATLPPEYNCRFQRGGYVQDRVRILHGHRSQQEFERIDRLVNRDAGTGRVYRPAKYPTTVAPATYTLRYSLVRSLKNDGMLGTLAKVPRKLGDSIGGWLPRTTR